MRWSHSVVVERPPSDVWVALRDASRWPAMFAGLVQVRWTRGDPMAVGSRIEAAWADHPAAPEASEVVAHEPWRSFTLERRRRGFVVRTTYSVAPAGAWTRLTAGVEVEPRSAVARLRVAGETRRAAVREQANLEGLRRSLELREAAAPQVLATPRA